MNEELNKKLIELIESAQSFTMENAPLYAKELLEYGVFSNGIAIVILSIPVIFLSLCIIRIFINKEEDINRACHREDRIFTCVLFLIMFLILLIIPVIEIVKVKIAPRVYILEKLKES